MAHDKEKYEQFRKEVWERDYGVFIKDRKLKKGRDEWKSVCVFWKCLTNEEKEQFLETWKDELWRAQLIDVAHILPRSVSPKHKYDKDNACLCNNLAHGSLDAYRSPLTNKPITRAEKYVWFEKMRTVAMDNQRKREGKNGDT